MDYASIEEYRTKCWLSVKEWIDGIESGKRISNHWIKLAIKRYRDDLKRDDLEFRNDEVDRVLNFLYFAHILIDNGHKRFVPVPWQIFFLMNVFGFFYKGQDNQRRYRYAYLFIAKKNGKSTFIALLQLYGMLACGVENPETIFIANKKEQAKIAFDYAVDIINHTKPFFLELEPQNYTIKFREKKNKDGIKIRKTGYMKVLPCPAKGKGLDGGNLSMGLVDEIKEMENHDIFNIIRRGTVGRDNPLIFLTTTAGPTMINLAIDLLENGKRCLKGDIKDDSFFYLLFCLDDKDDYNDVNLWEKANPSIGYTLKLRNLVSEWETSKNMLPDKEKFLITQLNIFTNTSDRWVEPGLISKVSRKLDIKDFYGERCWAGIDLSAVKDFTSLSLLFYRDELFYLFTYFFLPNDPNNLFRKNGIDLSYWIRDKHIIRSQTPSIDYKQIYRTVEELTQHIKIKNLCYDPNNSASLIPDLEYNLSINAEVFAQTAARFNTPIKQLEIAIRNERIVIQDNPVLKWNFDNVVPYIDGNLNIKFMKNKSRESIDGAVSSAMAMGAYLSEAGIMDISPFLKLG